MDNAFGKVLAASDFQRDGRSDLAISIPNEPVNGLKEAGQVDGPTGLRGARADFVTTHCFSSRPDRGNLAKVVKDVFRLPAFTDALITGKRPQRLKVAQQDSISKAFYRFIQRNTK